MIRVYEDYSSEIYKDGTGRYTPAFGVCERKSIEHDVVIVDRKKEHEPAAAPEPENEENKNEGTRRIPTGEGIMDDKKFNDLIYSYLQSVSNRVPAKEDRYVWKANFIKKDVAKLLKINFRTFQRKFDYLVDNGYVIETDRTYELPKISTWNFYIPIETLKYLVHTVNEDVIMVYSYLGQLKNSIDNKNKKFNLNKKAYFTKSDLLIRLGYKTKAKVKGQVIERASTHQKDWEKINYILDMLDDKLNLIKCNVVKEPYKDGYIEKIYYTVNTEINIKDCYK